VAAERRFLSATTGFDERSTHDFVRSNLAQGNPHFVAVAGPEESVVGWCDITPTAPWDGFRHVGRLGMGLLPAWRGRGHGRMLLREALGDCPGRRFHRVELEVLASNARAIRLYECAGFRHEGRSVAACILDGRLEDILRMALLMGPLSGRA
jgi:ribosomal protein S18 acetylase RimI-like enzyme